MPNAMKWYVVLQNVGFILLLCDNKILMKGLLASEVIAKWFYSSSSWAILNNVELVFALFDITMVMMI